MTDPSEPHPVKLLCGMISADEGLFEKAAAPLTEAFGPIDLLSDVADFDMTHYYDDQMGAPLYRKFASFSRLIAPDALADAKRRTNAIETTFARAAAGCARPINLDPGYVAPSKLVLASMKDFSQRIYLARGVYAEITLLYRRGRWEPLPWTFPDFASGRYDAFLTEVRTRLRDQTHRKENP